MPDFISRMGMNIPYFGASDSNPDSDIALVPTEGTLRKIIILCHLNTSIGSLKPLCEQSLSVASDVSAVAVVWR